MTAMDTGGGVEITMRLLGARVVAAAVCGACGERTENSVDGADIIGFSGREPARDAQARAVLTRAVLGALRAKGCAHAIHDRAAVADCALRPDRARLAGVLAALFDVSEACTRELLCANGLLSRWQNDRLELVWRRGTAPLMEGAVAITQHAKSASASVTMAADEAWEMLSSRGFVPVPWLDAEERSFRSHIEQGIARATLPEYVTRYPRERVTKASERGADPKSAAPKTLRACVTMAADCDGAIAAEALVREVLERLEPWGVSRVRRVSWRVVDASRWRTERQSYWSQSLRATVASVTKDVALSVPVGYGPMDTARSPSWWSLAAAESSLARLWDDLARAGVTRPDGMDEARLRDFRALANPYEPLLAIWSTGFVFDELMPDEAVLVAAQW